MNRIYKIGYGLDKYEEIYKIFCKLSLISEECFPHKNAILIYDPSNFRGFIQEAQKISSLCEQRIQEIITFRTQFNGDIEIELDPYTTERINDDDKERDKSEKNFKNFQQYQDFFISFLCYNYYSLNDKQKHKELETKTKNSELLFIVICQLQYLEYLELEYGRANNLYGRDFKGAIQEYMIPDTNQCVMQLVMSKFLEAVFVFRTRITLCTFNSDILMYIRVINYKMSEFVCLTMNGYHFDVKDYRDFVGATGMIHQQSKKSTTHNAFNHSNYRDPDFLKSLINKEYLYQYYCCSLKFIRDMTCVWTSIWQKLYHLNIGKRIEIQKSSTEEPLCSLVQRSCAPYRIKCFKQFLTENLKHMVANFCPESIGKHYLDMVLYPGEFEIFCNDNEDDIKTHFTVLKRNRGTEYLSITKDLRRTIFEIFTSDLSLENETLCLKLALIDFITMYFRDESSEFEWSHYVILEREIHERIFELQYSTRPIIIQIFNQFQVYYQGNTIYTNSIIRATLLWLEIITEDFHGILDEKNVSIHKLTDSLKNFTQINNNDNNNNTTSTTTTTTPLPTKNINKQTLIFERPL